MNASSPDAPPRVSVVIPNYNGAAWLPGCLDALAGQTFRDYETLVVDDASVDDSLSLLAQHYPGVRVLELKTRTGFAAGVNAGIRAARGEYIALLNTDTVVRPAWLAALVHALDGCSADTGAVASKMLSMDDPEVVDDAGDALSWSGAAEKVGHGEPAANFVQRREVFSVSAGAALYRRSFLDATSGFDERFFAYLEDVDLGLRGRILGFTYVFEPTAEVLHKGYGAGLRRADYVRLVTRNRAMLLAKNVPLSLLLKHLHRLVYGQLYFFVVYRRPFATLAGYVSLLRCIPHIVRARRWARSSTRIDRDELDRHITLRMSEPPLRSLVRRRARLRP